MLARAFSSLRAFRRHFSTSMTKIPHITPPRANAQRVVVPNETQEQRIARAKGYPYPRPSESFIFVNGKAYTFPCSSWTCPEDMLGLRVRPAEQPQQQRQLGQEQGQEHDSGCSSSGQEVTLGELLEQQGIDAELLLPPGTPFTPLLAIGSNASPEQLARKFPAAMFPEGVVVPVIQCVLKGFDVCYAPLITSYGSAAATLEASPGTVVSVFMTYLTPPLQQRMHETEGAYNLLRLEGVELLEGLGLEGYRRGQKAVRQLNTVYNYNHQHGTLLLPMVNPGCQPVALAEIPAEGRSFTPLTQVQMQVALRQGLQSMSGGNIQLQPVVLPKGDGAWEAAEAGLEDWIVENLDDKAARKGRVAALTAAAQEFGYPKAQVLLAIGNMFSANVK